MLVGVFFTFACAAYWIFERDRAEILVMSLLPRQKRRVVRDTWNLIDAKLGAYVRGLLILVTFVASVLSLIFYLIGLPFWLLIGIFAGSSRSSPCSARSRPARSPSASASPTRGSWRSPPGSPCSVVRLFEDYVVIPRVLGHAVGLTPLTVLVSVTAIGILFGGFAVFLAIPFAAVLATLAGRDHPPPQSGGGGRPGGPLPGEGEREPPPSGKEERGRG